MSLRIALTTWWILSKNKQEKKAHHQNTHMCTHIHVHIRKQEHTQAHAHLHTNTTRWQRLVKYAVFLIQQYSNNFQRIKPQFQKH